MNAASWTVLWLSRSRSAEDLALVRKLGGPCRRPHSAEITHDELRTFTARRHEQAHLGVDVQGNTARDGRGLDVDRRLGCRAIVAVVEPADVRRHDDPPARRWRDRARDRRVLPECQVRS